MGIRIGEIKKRFEAAIQYIKPFFLRALSFVIAITLGIVVSVYFIKGMIGVKTKASGNGAVL